MVKTAFAPAVTWCRYGYMLAINDNDNIKKCYEWYKKRNNIRHVDPLSDVERLIFEKKFMNLADKKFRELYRRNFAYPGTSWDRQLFTEAVNAMNINSVSEDYWAITKEERKSFYEKHRYDKTS